MEMRGHRRPGWKGYMDEESHLYHSVAEDWQYVCSLFSVPSGETLRVGIV